MKTTILFLPFSLLLLSLNLSSQSVDVSIENLYERRSSDPYGSHMLLKMYVDGFNKEEEGRKIKISEAYAIDEYGDSLHLINSRWEYFHISTDCSVSMDLPSRKTQVLPLIQGKVKVFTPSAENGSVVRIKNFISQPNETFLVNHTEQLKVVILDSLDYDALFKEFRIVYKEELLKDNPSLTEENWLEMSALLDNMEASSKEIDRLDSVLRIITNDQESNIVAINIYDQDGEKQNSSGVRLFVPANDEVAALLPVEFRNFKHLKVNTINLGRVPDEDWEIEIIFANANSTKEYTFTLQDVTLP